jgi:hypothetical protein
MSPSYITRVVRLSFVGTAGQGRVVISHNFMAIAVGFEGDGGRRLGRYLGGSSSSAAFGEVDADQDQGGSDQQIAGGMLAEEHH